MLNGYFASSACTKKSDFHCLFVNLDKSKVVEILMWEEIVLVLDTQFFQGHNLCFPFMQLEI